MLSIAILLAVAKADRPFFQRDQWIVLNNDRNCLLVGDFERNARIWVSYDYALKNSRVTFTDRAFRSVDETKEYDIKLSFVKGRTIDDGWGEIRARGIRIDQDGGLTFFLRSDELLDDITSSSILALYANDNIIASLSLTGSRAAVSALRACAKQANQINPSDPLDGAETNSPGSK